MKKSDFVVRDVHSFHEKFHTISELKSTLMNEFSSMLPESREFKVGYFLGKQSTKYWLMCEKDLENMNQSISQSKTVLLWCDARSEQYASENKRQKKSGDENEPPCKRQLIENETDEVTQELKEKHGTKYSLPQFRCWARLLLTGKHDSKDEIPEFLINQPKKPKPVSLAEAITGAVKTFTEAVKCPPTTSAPVVIENSNSNVVTSPCVGISPSKIADLRMKKLQELRELQALMEQSVLTQDEFQEQKHLVLDSLRKLTH